MISLVWLVREENTGGKVSLVCRWAGQILAWVRLVQLVGGANPEARVCLIYCIFICNILSMLHKYSNLTSLHSFEESFLINRALMHYKMTENGWGFD